MVWWLRGRLNFGVLRFVAKSLLDATADNKATWSPSNFNLSASLRCASSQLVYDLLITTLTNDHRYLFIFKLAGWQALSVDLVTQTP